MSCHCVIMCGKRLLFSVLEISVMKKEEKVTKRSVLKSGFADASLKSHPRGDHADDQAVDIYHGT